MQMLSNSSAACWALQDSLSGGNKDTAGVQGDELLSQKASQTKITTHSNNDHLYPIADAVLWLWRSGWLELKLMVDLLGEKNGNKIS